MSREEKEEKNESRLRISSRVVVEWPIKIGWYGAIIFIASGPPRRMRLPLHSYVTQLSRILYVAWKTIVCWRFLVKTVLLNVGVALCILNRLESLPTESPHRLKLSKRPNRTAFLIYTELWFILFHYTPLKRFLFSFFFLIIVEITTKTSDIDSIKVTWNAFGKYSEGLRLANVMLSADERSGTTDSRAQRIGTG